MKKLLAAVVLSFACSSTKPGGPAPAVTDFHATPAVIQPGASATLAWAVTGATALSIDQGIGVVTGTSVTVRPADTITYTLTATNAAGNTTATATLKVQAAPVISAFSATPSSVTTGGAVTLSWTVAGHTALKLDPGGIDVLARTAAGGNGSQVISSVGVPTTFVLTATNAAGSVTRETPVTTHSPTLQFNYTDPTSATARLLLVQNAAASTKDHLVLDLKVGSSAVTAFGVAMNIPFDDASTGMVAFGDTLEVNLSNLPAGARTVAARFNGAALPNTLTFGAAKQKLNAGDTAPTTWAPGSTLLSLAFDMTGTTAATTTVFSASTLQADPRFRAAALLFDGTVVVAKADVALGTFLVTN